MGKHYCKVEKKWCRWLNKGVCVKAKQNLADVNRCPKLTAIETVRFYEVLRNVAFDHVFERLCYWYPDQKSSELDYREVFNKLRYMTPHKHNLTDLFIHVSLCKEDDGTEWVACDGRDIVRKKGINYGIEFEPWNNWVSMFITQESLDNFSYEDIVAACLYEMTFFGFEEQQIKDKANELIKSVEECKAQTNKQNG